MTTYIDTAVVEAGCAAEARRLALQGANAWDESIQDIDPVLEVIGDPELDEQ